jgi:hypothetical protein
LVLRVDVSPSPEAVSVSLINGVVDSRLLLRSRSERPRMMRLTQNPGNCPDSPHPKRHEIAEQALRGRVAERRRKDFALYASGSRA